MKKIKSKVSYNYKGKLTKNNLTWQMQVRISRSSGIGTKTWCPDFLAWCHGGYNFLLP